MGPFASWESSSLGQSWASTSSCTCRPSPRPATPRPSSSRRRRFGIAPTPTQLLAFLAFAPTFLSASLLGTRRNSLLLEKGERFQDDTSPNLFLHLRRQGLEAEYSTAVGGMRAVAAAPSTSTGTTLASAAASTTTVTTTVNSAPNVVVTTSTSTAIVVGTSTSTASAPFSTSTEIPSDYEVPRAFDSTLGTNFTSTNCPSFFQTFLADPTFIACAPFSLLLATSTEFFQSERSPYSLLPYNLDAGCSVDFNQCSATMDLYATQIRLSNTCGPDLAQGNSLVVEALTGFQNYKLLRLAGCQRNNATNQYCFAEAAAQSTASMLYFYYLAEGTALPSGTKTACSDCTQQLMQLYATFATNTTLPISKTYASARSVAAISCGPSFSPLVAATTNTSAGARTLDSSLLPLFATTLLASFALILGWVC